jgi:hypothetical protein
LFLLGAGVVIFITEFWRDSEGRGGLFGGALNGPQAVAVLMVLAGGLLMRESSGTVEDHGIQPIGSERACTHTTPITDQTSAEGPLTKDEAEND